MNKFKLLIAEDEDVAIEAYKSSIDVIQHRTGRSINLVECKTVEDALEKIDNSFDGAIIDLRLAGEGDEGNQILHKIRDSLFRLPVAMVTGTPEKVDDEFDYIGIFTKGKTSYEDIINKFFKIHDTGITKIMGGRGKIEQTLNIVFQKNLLPHLTKWQEYGEADPEKAERALLRFTLNHLMQLLDEDPDDCYPEEVYIHPPLTELFKTGSIVASRDGKSFGIILSPACDLVLRGNGQMKTDQLLVVKIDDSQKIYGRFIQDEKLETEKKKEIVRAFLGNRRTLYYHWLPKTGFFPGGFINFRKLDSMSKKECNRKYNPPHIQVTPQFVKDILSRFSSYYARQGQPEIDHGGIVEGLFPSSEDIN